MVKRWTLYRDFRFENGRSDLSNRENDKALEVALYIKNNPSLKVALDFSKDSSANQELADRRCSSIRGALINAGVPSASIRVGEYGDKRLMQNSRISLLVSTQ